MMTHTYKLVLGLFAAVIIASTTYAFASNNTLLPGTRGEGVGDTSGYAVTDIAFNLNADPTRIDSVAFRLDGPAATVKIKLDDSSTWYACSNVTGDNWICQTEGVSLESVTQTRVIANSN